MKYIIIVFLFLSSTLLCSSQSANISFFIKNGIQDETLKHKIELNVKSLITQLNHAYLNKANLPKFDSTVISSDGEEMISDLWEDGHFYCEVSKISENLLQKKDYYMVRNIPFVFDNTDTLDVVLEFLPDGTINDFHIGLELHQQLRVLAGDTGVVVDQTRREIILNFLENFRTAYIKKDTAYINKIYSDDALIIVGKVLKTDMTIQTKFENNFTAADVQYLVVSKPEYIKRLKNVFNSISYLKLTFDSIAVVKHRKFPSFYGILLKQKWDSSNYMDDGWLFILVQFKEDEEPLIWVRTWQKAQDTKENDLFGLHNFIISGNKAY
jgi:hypothetical protein